MKRLFLIGALLFTPIVSNSKTNKMNCSDIHEVATNIMKGRQSGIDITKFADIVAETNGEGGVMELLLMDAYEQPKFSSQEYQLDAIKEFANKWYVACYKANKKI